jgi:hypothetical protein
MYGLSDELGTAIDTDVEAAPRAWFGYTSGNGRGVRARWWAFNHGFEGTFEDGLVDLHQSWDLDVVDLEVTSRSPIGCHWNALLAGGLRYVHSDSTEVLSDEFGAESAKYLSDSLGGTLGLEVQRPYFWNISTFANVRGSVLFGDEKADHPILFSEEDALFTIWEAQAGLQWSRQTWGNANLFGRVAGEVQHWDRAQFTVLGGRDAIGFAGLSFAMGVMR